MGTPVAGVGKGIPGSCNFSIAKNSKTFLKTWRESKIGFASEAVSGQSKKTALVIYLAFLAKMANLY